MQTQTEKPINSTFQLQNVTPKQHGNQQITEDLIQHLFVGRLSLTQASQKLGISRPRAYRLWNRWKQTTEAQMVDTEWWALFTELKESNPEKALECLTRLKYRMTTEKTEIKAVQLNKTELNLNLNGLTEEDKDAVISAGRLLIKKSRSTEQPISLH